MGWIIRNAIKSDMQLVAIIHKQIFKDHFIGMLPVFLIKRFYFHYLKDTANIFLVCIDKNQVLGFVLGGYSEKLDKCRKDFMRHNFISLLLSIIFTPWIYPLLYNRLRKEKHEFHSAFPFSLLSIGVKSEYRGNGIAKQLVSGFDDHLKLIDISVYELSVYKTNNKAIGFYNRLGFVKEGESDRLYHYYKSNK